MSAETLRRAATLLRETANAATPGPWRHEPGGEYHCGEPRCCSELWDDRVWGDGTVLLELDHTFPNAAHIALMHPGVALAVADWLDEQADYWEPGSDLMPVERHALTVARAVLGEESTHDPEEA